MIMKKILLLAFPTLLMFSCGGSGDSEGSDSDSTSAEGSMSFETLPAERTGIDFYNSITENDSFNFYNYEYIYNGGGVCSDSAIWC